MTVERIVLKKNKSSGLLQLKSRKISSKVLYSIAFYFFTENSIFSNFKKIGLLRLYGDALSDQVCVRLSQL